MLVRSPVELSFRRWKETFGIIRHPLFKLKPFILTLDEMHHFPKIAHPLLGQSKTSLRNLPYFLGKKIVMHNYY